MTRMLDIAGKLPLFTLLLPAIIWPGLGIFREHRHSPLLSDVSSVNQNTAPVFDELRSRARAASGLARLCGSMVDRRLDGQIEFEG
jgi:hypothetical protein